TLTKSRAKALVFHKNVVIISSSVVYTRLRLTDKVLGSADFLLSRLLDSSTSLIDTLISTIRFTTFLHHSFGSTDRTFGSSTSLSDTTLIDDFFTLLVEEFLYTSSFIRWIVTKTTFNRSSSIEIDDFRTFKVHALLKLREYDLSLFV